MRIVAGIIGVLLLAMAAHCTIGAVGGYDQSAAFLVVAVAVATAAGAYAIGVAVRRGHSAMAFAIAFGLVVLEGAALISLSHDATAWRETAEADRRAAQSKYEAALKQRDDARSALQAASVTPDVSPRQVAAQAALDAAVAAIGEKAGAGCNESCQRGLLSQASDARRELEAAQSETAELTDRARREAEGVLALAEEALAASPKPEPAGSSADRFGIEPWLLDILWLVLVRLPANVIGAAAIAVAAHGQVRLPWPVLPARGVCTRMPASATAAAPSGSGGESRGRGRVSRFVSDYLEVAPAGRIEVGDLFDAYTQWCRVSDLDAADRAEFGDELPEALDVAGLRVKAHRDKVYVVGVAVRA